MILQQTFVLILVCFDRFFSFVARDYALFGSGLSFCGGLLLAVGTTLFVIVKSLSASGLASLRSSISSSWSQSAVGVGRCIYFSCVMA